MDYKLQLVLIPVSDPDRSKAFYTDKAGFHLEVDTKVGEDMRVIQLTPAGSACSVGFGTGITRAAPGSAQGLHLIVADITAARAELTGRGVDVSDVRHMDSGTWKPGPDPRHGDYMSFADFADPDGNIWVLQEIGWTEPGS